MPNMNTGSPTTNANTVLSARGPYNALSNPNEDLLVGISGTKSGGFANILNAGPSQVKLALDVNIWTVIRAVDAERGNGLGPFAADNYVLDPFDTNCRQAYSGYTHNVLHAVTGGDKNSLRIAPAFTLDRRLRTAKIAFGSTGVTTHNTVRACLQPFSPYAQQGTQVQVFNWDHGTTAGNFASAGLPAPGADDLPFPMYGPGPGRLGGQLANKAARTPAPGTAGSDTSGTAGLCDNYPADTNSHPGITPDITGATAQPFPGAVAAAEAGGPAPAAPFFASYPYNFHRSPGLESATCSYDADGQPLGTGPGGVNICTETGISNSAIIDADVSVQNVTAEVLIGQGIPSGATP
jgi:hypothetical protein